MAAAAWCRLSDEAPVAVFYCLSTRPVPGGGGGVQLDLAERRWDILFTLENVSDELAVCVAECEFWILWLINTGLLVKFVVLFDCRLPIFIH